MAVAGFDEFPDELRDTPDIFVECAETEYEPDACGEWYDDFEIHPTEVMMDNRGFLHFDGIPTECPECGNEVGLRYNGVLVVSEP